MTDLNIHVIYEDIEKKQTYLADTTVYYSFEHLLKALSGLEIAEDGLANKALDYVLLGHHAELPFTLSTGAVGDKAKRALNFPALSTWKPSVTPFLTNPEAKLALGNARHQREFYKFMFSLLHNEQILRYAKLITAITKDREPKPAKISKHAPDWLVCLMTDGLCSTLNPSNPSLGGREGWTYQHLLSLLILDSASKDVAATKEGVAALISVMFERADADWNHRKFAMFYKLKDAKEFLTAHKDILEAVMPTLSSDAQYIFLTDFARAHTDLITSLPKLLVGLSLSSNKDVQAHAKTYLAQTDSALIHHYLNEYLKDGNAKQRAAAATLLADLGNDSLPILQSALATEKTKSVLDTITQAIKRLEMVNTLDEDTYLAPPVLPLEFQALPESLLEVFEQNYQELLENKRLSAEREIENNQKNKDRQYFWASDWAQREYKNFAKIKPEARTTHLLNALNGKGYLGSQNYIQIATYQGKLFAVPSYHLAHALQALYNKHRRQFSWYDLNKLISPKVFDGIEVRQVVELATRIGYDANTVTGELLDNYLQETGIAQYITDKARVLPFLYDTLEMIGEKLSQSIQSYDGSYQQAAIVRLIERYFEQTPKLLVSELLKIALSSNKTSRSLAQSALVTIPNIHERAIEALTYSKKELRLSAVMWLKDIRHPDAITPLYTLLKKEKDEAIIAYTLTTLEALGEDISIYLSTDALLSNAKKATAKASSSLDWLGFEHLPTLHWTDGTVVDEVIIRHWIVLADKLKDPKPNPLLVRYLELLNQKDATLLSEYLLNAFIAHDTKVISLEEATQEAQKDAPARLQNYQHWAKTYPDYYSHYAKYTLEDVIAELIKESQKQYLGSAIKHKGILALIHHARPIFVVEALKNFSKHHYLRRSQFEAMLLAISDMNDPIIIGYLLGLSRRYKMQSVRTLAKELTSAIAERNHWTADELADRTIASAGLDDNGELLLEYGERTLKAYVDKSDKFILVNEEGKTLKALPTPRQHDDKAQIKEAKTIFSHAKKEYKEVVEHQSQRLFEAMCSERTWTAHDWQTYLFAHPIAKRLLSRLVWLRLDKNKTQLDTFRPSYEEGVLLDLQDEEIHLNEDDTLQIAHNALLDDDTATAWLAHFKDYKIKPLFTQFNQPLPTFKAGATEIDTKKGYVTDTFTLRGVITKLGYKRDEIMDAGSFNSYIKPFDLLGINVVIDFSGSFVPEENMPAVLYALSFEKQTGAYGARALCLNEVPKVLLAVAYHDYLTVANATQGYQENWQQLTPW